MFGGREGVDGGVASDDQNSFTFFCNFAGHGPRHWFESVGVVRNFFTAERWGWVRIRRERESQRSKAEFETDTRLARAAALEALQRPCLLLHL